MKFSLLVSTSQLFSPSGSVLGVGTNDAMRHLSQVMRESGLDGNIYDLPIGSKNPGMASPFSLTNGFALNPYHLNYLKIPELNYSNSLQKRLQKLITTHRKNYRTSPRVNYALSGTLSSWILEECYQLFKDKLSFQRLTEYKKFVGEARYWLHSYALYEVYREVEVDLKQQGYGTLSSPLVRNFEEKYSHRLNYHKYVQFLCYEQRKSLLEQLRKSGIRLNLNLPFSVEIKSADVYFNPQIFFREMQVGAPPELEHGFPEQAWGVAAYVEKSEALEVYLKEKMKWLANFGDAVFFDHLIGWCGQYVLPEKLEEGVTEAQGAFLTEELEEREENLRWFLDIVMDTGLEVQGEILGDHDRVLATQNVLKHLSLQGEVPAVMSIPRWEGYEGKIKPLSDYEPHSLIMIGTHDTSTLLQFLTNRKGEHEDYESPFRILEYCRRVLGLPFHFSQVPVKVEELSQEVCEEILRRLVQGTDAHEVVFPISALISFLVEKHRNTGYCYNVNIQPGTSGEVDNLTNNWSFFSPSVESFIKEEELREFVQKFGKREYHSFDYFHEISCEEGDEEMLSVCVSDPKNRKIVYRAEGGWEILPEDKIKLSSPPILEMTVANKGETEAWGKINLAESFSIEKDKNYVFQDLNPPYAIYQNLGEELIASRFFVKLEPNQIHHFIVAEEL